MGTVSYIAREEWPSHDGGPPFRIVDFGQRPCPRCDCKLQHISDSEWLDCPCTCHEAAHAILTPIWRRTWT